MSADQNLINTEVLRQLIREELLAMRADGLESVERKDGDEELTVNELAAMKGVQPRTVYD